MSVIVPPKILVIDDSPTMRTAITGELHRMGAKVTEAPDGLCGLKEAQSGGFDLIITDVDMPGMDGFAVCNKLKQIPSTQSTPVIILSARDSEVDIEKGFTTGAAAYVSKANAKNELCECVKGLIERSSLVRGRMVLIADGSASIRRLIAKALLVAGYRITQAENLETACQVIKDKTPDLILCDLEIAKSEGFAFCRAVHSDNGFSEVPFIVMSSSPLDRAMIFRLRQNGASAFLVKPFSPDHLLITAERLLSDHFKHLLKEKTRLESERELILGSIHSLVLALEARDQYTRGHSDSVARIAVGMAQKMGFSREELENVKTAGTLHDLGKIGVRDDVLLKAGPLTAEEYALIKMHPSIGAEILSPIPSLAHIIPAILSHHERLDGKGYPNGIKGSNVPLIARILAVADTFDALTSNRPYRNKFDEAKALQIMEDAIGTQLCPDCMNAFLVLRGAGD
ncbi:MAG: response regulator [Syntrophobacteraceae bacterium]